MIDLEERETEERTTRRWIPIAIAAGVAVIAGLALLFGSLDGETPPATDAPPTTLNSTSESLQGMWAGGAALEVTFEGDSYLIMKLDVEPDRPWDQGTFTTDGSSITFLTQGSGICRPGEAGTYGLDLTEQRIVLTFDQDPCGSSRGFGFTSSRLERVEANSS